MTRSDPGFVSGDQVMHDPLRRKAVERASRYGVPAPGGPTASPRVEERGLGSRLSGQPDYRRAGRLLCCRSDSVSIR